MAYAKNWFTSVGLELAPTGGGFASIAEGGTAGNHVVFFERGATGGHVEYGSVTAEGVHIV